MNQSQAEVHGVIGFYHDFRTTPPAAHSLRLCRAEACQSMGSEALAAQLRTQLGWTITATPPTASWSCARCTAWGPVPVPALQLDGQLHARVTPEKLSALLASCSKEAKC
jgi:formate dehydrogenase subunit gamma